MNDRRSANLVLALITGALGCASPTTPGVGVASPPLTLSGDSPDHGCDVVLREAIRPREGGGYASVCEPSGACWYRWEVLVDVSDDALASGAEPGLLYQSGSDRTFWSAELRSEVEGAPPGFQRFRFDVAEHTVSPGMSLTSLMRTRIELIALITTPTGRLFDHNRHEGDWGNEVLTSDNQWRIEEDAALCPGAGREPSATLSFLETYREIQHGGIVRGGVLRVEYAQTRLRDCRSEYMSVPLWSLDATAVFLPGGQTFTGSVIQPSLSPSGQASSPVLDVPFEVTVPEDATEVQLYFRNHAEARGRCEAYDSDYGRNYRYAIADGVPAPAGWAGDWGTTIGRGFCDRQAGVADPLAIDSWIMSRATCVDILADVWIPGLTDQAELHPELVLAEVVFAVDGGPEERAWLEFVERVGNNHRYRWAIQKARMIYEPWSSYRYTFRFSTDGVNWLSIAREDGEARELLRAF